MTASRLQAGAAFLLALGGFLVATIVLAIVIAGLAVEAGIALNPADRLLLDDLAAVLPFILACRPNGLGPRASACSSG